MPILISSVRVGIRAGSEGRSSSTPPEDSQQQEDTSLEESGQTQVVRLEEEHKNTGQ